MKKRKTILAALMVAALGLFLLAGCGNSDTSSDNTTQTSSSDETTSTQTNDESDDSTLTIGEITPVGENSLTLSLYESEDDVTAATKIEPGTLKATGDSDTINIEEDATVERIVNGVTQTTTTDDLAVGDMVAISDDDGQLIVILDADSVADSDTNANTDGTSDTSDTTMDGTTTDSTTDTNTDSGNTASIE